MGRLVDTMLSLGAVSRQPLQIENVELRALAERARSALHSEAKDRQIEWKISALPAATCDSALIQQVFLQLLANSIKFTRGREKAIIQVGHVVVGGKPTIFVRDNGVGFNQEHSSQLFRLFHRLHQTEGFGGVGAGLAIVQRIIARHGGRVWTDAEPDKGATFYFTVDTLSGVRVDGQGELNKESPA